MALSLSDHGSQGGAIRASTVLDVALGLVGQVLLDELAVAGRMLVQFGLERQHLLPQRVVVGLQPLVEVLDLALHGGELGLRVVALRAALGGGDAVAREGGLLRVVGRGYNLGCHALSTGSSGSEGFAAGCGSAGGVEEGGTGSLARGSGTTTAAFSGW